MNTYSVLSSLFMCSANEACAISKQANPHVIVDLRAEAEEPVQGTVSKNGTRSFSLINGGPTSPEEMKQAIVFVSEQLKAGNRVVLH